MKILSRTILFSTLLILAMSQDPCTQIFHSAEESLNTFRSNFLANNFDVTAADLAGLRTSMGSIQKTCNDGLVNHISTVAHMPCSLIRVHIISILENYAWDKVSGAARRQDVASTLEEILTFLPKIEAQNCIDEWIFTKNANGVLNQDIMWPNMIDLDVMSIGQKENDTEIATMMNVIELEHENSDSTDGWSEIISEMKKEHDTQDTDINPYFEIEGELSFIQNTEEISVHVSLQDIAAKVSEEKQDELISALFKLDYDLNYIGDDLPGSSDIAEEEAMGL